MVESPSDRVPASTDVRMSLVAPFNILLRRPRLVALAGGLCAAIALAVGAFTRRYAADSDFTPSASAQASSTLLSLASQLGVGTSLLGATGESVDFYADLVKSREVLTSAAQTTYRFPTDESGRDSIAGTLVDIYSPRGSTVLKRLQRTVRELDRNVSVNADQTSDIVSVRVRAKWPALAEQINARLLELVNQFNVARRESQATIERRFVEQRLAGALDDLTAAEDSLKRFLERNRTYQQSPNLTFEENRLQRRVDLRQQLYTTLAQAFDQARIDEARNTPVVTILDHPQGSARATRTWALIIAGAAFFGLLGGIGAAFCDELLTRQELENPKDFAEFRNAWRQLWRVP